MMISSENTGKVTEEESFPCTVFFKKGGCDSILCQVCWCWVHQRVHKVQKKYSNFKSQNVQNSKQIYQRIFQT